MNNEIGTCSIDKADVIKTFEREKTLVLATCADGRVTIRTMSHVSDGPDIYFQTGADSLKMRQIRENPNVAMTVGPYDIEGTAAELGHPLSAENALFKRLIKEKHPDTFKRWSALEDEVVVKVTVRSVRQWKYVDGKPFIAEGEF